MKYKGYIGEVKYDDRDKILHGRVVNISRDIISSEGNTVEEIEKDFREAIDDYFEFLKKRDEEPEKPFLENSLLGFLMNYTGLLLRRQPGAIYHLILLRESD